MASGGHWHSRTEWDRVEAPLLQLDSVLASFASRFKLELTKNRKDWPDRSLQWNDGVRRLIQIYLADEHALTFNLWVCASQDREGKRFWKQDFLIQARPAEDFQAELDALLLRAKALLDSWEEGDLEFITELQARVHERSG